MALVIGGFIAMLIGSIVIMFTSGWVAGYLAYRPAIHECLGSLYGFVTWCLALIIAIILAAHALEFFTSHYHAMYMSGSDLMVTAHNATTATTPAGDTVVANTTKIPGNAIFLTFLLFLVGAISSTLGGHFGIKSRRIDNPSIR